MRGKRIASSGSVLGPYIASGEVGAILVNVDGMEQAAVDFYNGNPLNLDGYTTNSPVAKYLHGTFGTGKGVLSEPFVLASRALENKAMPASYALHPRIHAAINTALDNSRKDGTLADLMANAIPQIAATSVDDIPVDATTYTVTGALCATLYALLFIAIAVLLVRHFTRRAAAAPRRGNGLGAAGAYDGNDDDGPPPTNPIEADATAASCNGDGGRCGGTAIVAAEEADVVTWRGRQYRVAPGHLSADVLDAIVRSLPTVPCADTDPHSTTDNC